MYEKLPQLVVLLHVEAHVAAEVTEPIAPLGKSFPYMQSADATAP